MRSILLFSLACGAACSSSSSSKPAACDGLDPDATQACITKMYFEGYQPNTLDKCARFAGTSQKVGGSREIAFFRSPAITDAEVTLEGQYLQRFYSNYDLTFFSRQYAQPVAYTYALEGTKAELDAAGEQAGLTPGARPTPDQQKKLDELVGNILFADLRTFVKGESNPVHGRVDVVVLEHIASPDVAAEFNGAVIAGLGISPVLFKNISETDSSKDLFAALGLPADFTPTLFVGHTDIVRLAGNPDGIVAHEMGHALGLQHTTEAGNLMTQGQATEACTPGLTVDQVAQLKGAGDVVGSTDGWEFLLEAKRRVVASTIARRTGIR